MSARDHRYPRQRHGHMSYGRVDEDAGWDHYGLFGRLRHLAAAAREEIWTDRVVTVRQRHA